MSKKKSVTYTTVGQKTQSDRKKELMSIHLDSNSLNKNITTKELALACGRGVGVHNSANAEKRSTKGKGKTLKNASRKAVKVLLKQNGD